MRTLLALLIVVSLAQEPIVLAMKTFEIGPVQGTLRMKPQVGGVPGDPLPGSSYITTDAGDKLTTNAGDGITPD